MTPLVRLSIARGLRYPEVADLLKEIYVDACSRFFRLHDKRMTDSRVSLLTGLQRKDIKGVREKLNAAEPNGAGQELGLIPRVIARWASKPPYATTDREPLPLARIGDRASFASLVAEVSRDVHARTILDEFLRLGVAEFNGETDEVRLLEAAFLPSRDEAALLVYFGANLGDHAAAASRNIQAAPEAGPFFERAVHYNQLSKAALDELDQMARTLQSEVLAKLNARALELQTRDAATDGPKGRFRCGAFIYQEGID